MRTETTRHGSSPLSCALASLVDGALEATIVGSFTKLGIRARRRVGDWDDLPRIDGRLAVVTGATSGIGRATAEELLGLGADVVVTSRSTERAEAAAHELNERTTGDGETTGTARGHALDTADFASITALADELRRGDQAVDVLIHNAGALTSEYHTDDRGTELTLSTHLVGPYLLTKQLRPALTPGARVLFMSSGGMYTQKLDVDRLDMGENDYRGALAYARAKRAQVELVAHLGPEWAPQVEMHAVHPGWVDTPGVDAGLPGFGKVMGPLLRTAAEGADTMVWLASRGGDGPPGSFWHDRRIRRIHHLPGTGASTEERRRLLEWLELRILPAAIEQ